MKNNSSSSSDNIRRLDVLGMVYYVLAVVSTVAGGFFLFQVPDGGLFSVGVLLVGLACLVGGACLAMAGRLIRGRRGRRFCLVVGALMCPLFIPIGTVIGVFTIMLLSKDDVKAAFARGVK